MDDTDFADGIRLPLHQRNAEAIVAMLTVAGLPADRLQMAGCGVLIALADGRAAAGPPAQRLLDALAERRWAGDEELAAEVRAALGIGPDPQLKTVPVSLSELADAMDTNDYGGRINLQNGDVRHALPFGYDDPEEMDPEDFDDPDTWLAIEPAGSRTGWDDMAAFVATVTDDARASRLARAIQGGGAFRRFKDTLYQWPDEQSRWYAFSDDRHLGRAREFLADQGYRSDRF